VHAGHLRVLVVATKSPFPPTNGGSLALHCLLQALSDHGVEVRVVAPGTRPASAHAPYPQSCLPTRPKPWPLALPGLVTGRPLTVARFRLPRLAEAVTAEIAAFAPHVVHLEQLHLAGLIPRIAGHSAVILREQNVESLLVARVAELLPGPLRRVARLESRRLARFEAAACTAANIVAAITDGDAAALRALAPRACVEVLPAPFAFQDCVPRERLRGSPPFLCLGSFDWLPNRDGVRWLVREVWPRLRRLAPRGVLHIAGRGSASLARDAGPSVERHGPVQIAASFYDPRAVVLIPVRAGSGVRMRLLEAWAAGVPVVATPVAAAGLADGNEDGVLLASSAGGFASAAARLTEDPELRLRILERGRSKLSDHEPVRIAARARQLYLRAAEAWRP
jgi:glycosyltransferase involved in cell wall biosynthesis